MIEVVKCFVGIVRDRGNKFRRKVVGMIYVFDEFIVFDDFCFVKYKGILYF